MILTTLLLSLKLLTLSVEPGDPLKKDDQTLATCAVKALTARPSALVIAPSPDGAAARLIVANDPGFRLHVVGKLVTADGTVLVEGNHTQKGFNRTLCRQLDGLLEQMVKTYGKKK